MFDELHSLPFDEYMAVCRKHAYDSGFLNYFDTLGFLEMLWARRYWYVKNGEYDDN